MMFCRITQHKHSVEERKSGFLYIDIEYYDNKTNRNKNWRYY